MYLTTTSDKIRVTTSSANSVLVHASYVDLSGSTVTPGRLNTSIAAAATTDVVGSPSGSDTRVVKFLSVWNDHASSAQTITVFHTDGTTTADLWSGSVPAQSGLIFDDSIGWKVSSPFPSADIQTFDYPGGDWIKPTGPRTGLTLVRLWGGGGGGGGGRGSNPGLGGAGGVGGAG